MPKQRDKNSEEWYKGQIRELTKENRSLKKENLQLKRHKHMYDDLKILTELEQDVAETKSAPKENACPSCKEGVVKVVLDFDDRTISSCDTCDFKRSMKK